MTLGYAILNDNADKEIADRMERRAKVFVASTQDSPAPPLSESY
jgi:hypothetical protein